MKHSKLTFQLLFLSIVLTLAACGGGDKLPYAIDKGKIQDDFDITVTDKAVTLKHNEFFTLAQIGVEASKKPWKWNADETINQYRDLARNKYPGYNITINKKGYPQYYGKVLFLNASKESANTEAVARYYEIKIPASFFDKSTGGRIACVYEYSQRYAGKKAAKGAIKPTWIIWLSDAPM